MRLAHLRQNRIVEIPNLNFDTWAQNGKNWYPNSDAANSFWATGNEGVTLGGNSNSMGVEDSRSGLSAQLQTVQVKVLIVKVKAAGNLFIGSYKTNTSNPASSVTFGRPYEGARPTKLSGYFKYQPGDTMSSGSVPADRTLTSDECDIYIQLCQETKRLVKDTSLPMRQYLNILHLKSL